VKEKNILIIFVKNQEPGKVKTRLAKTKGEQNALKVYRRLVEITLEAAIGTEADKQVWYSSHADQEDGIDEHDFKKFVQIGTDLGERMSVAFRKVFYDGCKRAIIIGSDCPDITTELLEEAFTALERYDMVIGPAADGGYYLLGMNRYIPDLFTDIPWSTHTVLKCTMKKINEKNLSCYTLPELNDIDTEQDLKESGLKL